MPDIATALKSAINSWDAANTQPPSTPEPAPPSKRVTFRVTTNTSRATFEFIRDNPGLTTREMADRLEEMGYMKDSTTSLVSQFINNALVRRDPDTRRLYAIAKEYAPLKKLPKKRRTPRKATIPRREAIKAAVEKARMETLGQMRVELQARAAEQERKEREERAAQKLAAKKAKAALAPEPAPQKSKYEMRLHPAMSEEAFVKEVLSKVSVFGARLLYDRLCTVFEK